MKRLLATLLCITGLGLALAQANDLKVSLDDILLLANRDVSDQTILVFVQSRGIGFTPDAGDIDKMLEAGISEEVIRYLLEESALAATAPTYSYQQLPTYIAPYPAYYYYPYYSKPPIYYGFSGLLHAGYINHSTRHHSMPRHTTPRHPYRKHYLSPSPPLHHGSNRAVHISTQNYEPHIASNPGHIDSSHTKNKSASNSHHAKKSGKQHRQKYSGKHKSSLSRGHIGTGSGHHGGSH